MKEENYKIIEGDIYEKKGSDDEVLNDLIEKLALKKESEKQALDSLSSIQSEIKEIEDKIDSVNVIKD